VSSGRLFQWRTTFEISTSAPSTLSFVAGRPLPAFASADERLGPLRTATFGATYGFRLPGSRGEFTLRAEYLYQWLVGRPPTATAPTTGSGGGDNVRRAAAAADDGSEGGGQHLGTNIGTLLIGYSVPF